MLSKIKQKILNKERITFEEGVDLYKHPNLLEIGELGRLVKGF